MAEVTEIPVSPLARRRNFGGGRLVGTPRFGAKAGRYGTQAARRELGLVLAD